MRRVALTSLGLKGRGTSLALLLGALAAAPVATGCGGSTDSQLVELDTGADAPAETSDDAVADTSDAAVAETSAETSAETGAAGDASPDADAGASDAAGDADACVPTGPELCNGLDDDCNGLIDDGDPQGGAACATGLKGVCATGLQHCVKGVVGCTPDHGPGEVAEKCNGLDDDCDGFIDNGLPTQPYYKDDDADGFGTTATLQACGPVAGYAAASGDCNDLNKDIHPGATEVCNGIDDNCNGLVDEFVSKPTFYKDNDGDGWGGTTSTTACTAPAGYVADSGDCNDFNPKIYPKAPETCNDVDDDCNGLVDDGVATVAVYRDVDGDTFGAVGAVAVQHCLYGGTAPPLGYSLVKGDCDDSKSTVYPGARELCDGVLNDCNFASIGADYQCPKACAGWPQIVGGNAGVVATAQLDGDNEFEVVTQIAGTVRAFEHNGAPKWSASPGGANYSYPALGDLNGDGWLDVVVPGPGVVNVLSGPTGAVLVSIPSPNAQVYYGASLFDVDGDGYVDIVPSGGPGIDLLLMGPGATLKKRVALAAPTGEAAFSLANSLLADLDGDGVSEISAGSSGWQCGGTPTSCRGRFYSFHADGSLFNDPTWTSTTLPWFKVNAFPSSYAGEGRFPSFAGVSGDGSVQVLQGFNDKNYVWKLDGTEHAASGTLDPTFLAPVEANGTLTTDGHLVAQGGAVVDLEGDGKYEVVKAVSGGLGVFSGGVMMDGYPIPIGASPPIVADIDRDGALDILWLGANNAVNCWTMAPKTYSAARVLHPGGYATMGAAGIYPTNQLDPYEPNQPSDTALDPTTSTTPGTSFRAFTPSGMRDRWQSGASGYHELRALIGKKGDVDYYYLPGAGYTYASVQSLVPSRLSLDATLYVYTGSGASTKYACQVAVTNTTSTSLNYHPVSATGTCPAGLAVTGFLLKISGHDPTKDFGAYPYLVNFPWR